MATMGLPRHCRVCAQCNGHPASYTLVRTRTTEAHVDPIAIAHLVRGRADSVFNEHKRCVSECCVSVTQVWPGQARCAHENLSWVLGHEPSGVDSRSRRGLVDSRSRRSLRLLAEAHLATPAPRSQSSRAIPLLSVHWCFLIISFRCHRLSVTQLSCTTGLLCPAQLSLPL